VEQLIICPALILTCHAYICFKQMKQVRLDKELAQYKKEYWAKQEELEQSQISWQEKINKEVEMSCILFVLKCQIMEYRSRHGNVVLPE